MGVTAAVAAVGSTLFSVGNSMDQQRRAAHTAADQQKQAQTAIDSAMQSNPQPVMPTPDGAAVQAASQASIAEQVARRGRASTILTGPQGDKLGS